MTRHCAFLFPGQGAQYEGMGKDFFTEFPIARQTFEEADDLLKRSISHVAFSGPADALKETQNSQLAIFAMSVAIWRTLNQLFPELKAAQTAGLSLGEYSALVAAEGISFAEALPLVDTRSALMSESCHTTRGTMAAILGLDAAQIAEALELSQLKGQVFIANLNCPGQVVISGTLPGIEKALIALKEKGAKRAIALEVQGAFHSPLMQEAQDRLRPWIEKAPLSLPKIPLIHNRTAERSASLEALKKNLIEQVTAPVLWQKGVATMQQESPAFWLEIGPGASLSGFNKRIGVQQPTLNIGQVKDIARLEEFLSPSRGE
ncbi:MAG: fabD [Chlamydiales bacterium]|jgi:[acyl-carrier-protein] S-malonyltransferase|nr:fabD [Chlamydiales bacterium]